jgi:hypothetical protein
MTLPGHLTEDVLAGPQSAFRLLGVQVGWRADDDGLDSRVGEEFAELGRGHGGAELFRQGARRLQQPAHDANETDSAGVRRLTDTAKGEGMLVCDGAIADDRDVHWTYYCLVSEEETYLQAHSFFRPFFHIQPVAIACAFGS